MKYIKMLFLLILGVTLLAGCQKINLNDEVKKVNVKLNVNIEQTKLMDVSKKNVVFEKYDENKFEISFDIEKIVSENKLVVKYKLVLKSNKQTSDVKEKHFANFLIEHDKNKLNEIIENLEVKLNVVPSEASLLDVTKENILFGEYDKETINLEFEILKKENQNKLVVTYKLISKFNSSIESDEKEKEFIGFLIEDAIDKLNKLVDKITVEFSGNISEIYLTNITKEDIIFKNYPIDDYIVDYLITKDLVNNSLKVTYKLKDKLDNSLVSKTLEKTFTGFKSDLDNQKDPNFENGGTINGYTTDRYLFLLERFDFINKKNIYPSYQVQKEIIFKKPNIDLKLTIDYLNDKDGVIKYYVVGKYFDEDLDSIMEITGFHVKDVNYSISQNLTIKADSYVQLIEDKVTIEQYKNKPVNEILKTLESLKLQDQYNNVIDVFDEVYSINITNVKVSGNYLKMFFNISRKLYKYEKKVLTVVEKKGIYSREVELKYFDNKDILDYILSKVSEKVVNDKNPSHLYGFHNGGISIIGHLFDLDLKYENYFSNKKVFVEILSVSANDLDGELYVTYRTKINEERTFSNNIKKTKFVGLEKVTEKHLKDEIYLIQGEDYTNSQKLNEVLKKVVNHHLNHHLNQDKKYDANDPLIYRVFPAKSFYINPEVGFIKYTDGLKKKFVLTIGQNDIIEYYDEATKLFDVKGQKIYFNNIHVEFTGVTIAYNNLDNMHYVSADFKISLEVLNANSNNNEASRIIEFENNVYLRKYDKIIQ